MSEAYQRAGVDLEAAAKAVGLIGDLAAQARRPEVREGVGGFAGLFDIGGGRLLAAATDGVGTKLEIARATGRLTTVGIDLVAMCADDIVCTGAEPLFFLDYIAAGRVIPEDIAALVEGVAEGCRRAGCALLGGETAEHPGVMPADQFDLAGFCVGVVQEAEMLGPHRVREGDALIGLESTGLHSNGYSLVRSALLTRYGLDDTPPGLARSLADELLEPCAIYAPIMRRAIAAGLVSAAAHITGGGFTENIPRALPEGLCAEVEEGSWPVQPIFKLVGDAAEASNEDMYATFNMGIGMVLIVPGGRVDEALEAIGAAAHLIGRVGTGAGVRRHRP